MLRAGGCGLLLAMLCVADAHGADPEPLPAPELAEPFSIGEALYDPARVEQGVVSLVARMGIPLDDALIRGLVMMGQDDLANAKGDRLPWTFRDLHAAIKPLQPQLTVQQLAERYTEAYAAAPDSFAAQVMLGMPLEPATPLTRPQIWFLLVDGFAPPAVAPQVASLNPLVLAAASGPSYGTASLTMQQLPSPLPGISLADFQYLISILPMLSFRVPFDVQPLVASGHEGHGGPGAPVSIAAHIGVQAPPVIGPSGSVLLQPLPGDRSGRMVFFQLRDRAAMERHGSFDIPNGVPARTDFPGSARLTFTPKPEAANRRSAEFAETSSVNARIAQWDLLTAVYQVPPALRGLALGDRTTPGILTVAWHDEGIRIHIENEYVARLDLGPLGGGKRSGKDVLDGTLSEQADGSWSGTVEARITMSQEIHGPGGVTCTFTRLSGTQKMRVSTEPETTWNEASTITYDPAAGPGQRSGKFVSLNVEPVEAPAIPSSAPCLTLYQRSPRDFRMLPLNDGRWTQPGYGYTIELPASGKLVWTDKTVNTYPLIGTTSPGPADAFSKWKVEVERL